MIYVIDHEDSFTYNLVHLLDNFGTTYVSNYFDIDKKKLDACKIIVFSPGPGDPSHYPETQKIYHQFKGCLLYTSPSPRDKRQSRMPSSA